MAKKQKPAVYVGSLTFHWFQYVTKWHMFCNMKDPYAYKFLNHWHHLLNSDYVAPQPNFEHSFKMIQGLNNHSHLIIGWVNGIDKKFYLNGSNNIHELVRMRIDEYNQLCEEQRDEDGNDDEPEDETKLLI